MGFQVFNSTEDVFSRYGDLFGDLFGNGPDLFRGSGQVGRRAGRAFLMTPCPTCHGRGIDPTAACPSAGGPGSRLSRKPMK